MLFLSDSAPSGISEQVGDKLMPRSDALLPTTIACALILCYLKRAFIVICLPTWIAQYLCIHAWITAGWDTSTLPLNSPHKGDSDLHATPKKQFQSISYISVFVICILLAQLLSFPAKFYSPSFFFISCFSVFHLQSVLVKVSHICHTDTGELTAHSQRISYWFGRIRLSKLGVRTFNIFSGFRGFLFLHAHSTADEWVRVRLFGIIK